MSSTYVDVLQPRGYKRIGGVLVPPLLLYPLATAISIYMYVLVQQDGCTVCASALQIIYHARENAVTVTVQ